MRLSPLIALCLLGSSSLAQDIELQRTHSRWRLGLETLDADDRGDAQLVGVHYDLLGVLDDYRPFYAGVGAYTQFAGDLSGVFAAGFTSGVRYPIDPNWGFEAGVFLGGGGINNRSGQRGWIARPFVALERRFTRFGLRAELAYFDIDDLDGSLGFSLGLTLPSEWLVAEPSQLPDRIPKSALVPRETRITPRFVSVNPSSSAESRDGQALGGDFELLGLGLDYFLNEHWFLPVEAYGASGGDVDGFGLALVGIGYRQPIAGRRLDLEAKALVGVASGGQVNTGGGLGASLGAGLRANLTSQISAELGSSILTAPNGEFSATTVSLGLSWSAFPIELSHSYPRGKLWDSGISDEDATIGDTRLGVVSKFYSPTSDSRTKSGTALRETISLIGLELVEPINELFSATGRTFVAWNGEVGSYREALLGLRVSHSTFEKPEYVFSFGFEAGAAGGGGVDVGSGLLTNLNVGFQYVLSSNSRIQLEYGRSKAASGSFEAESVSVGMSWNLRRAMIR